MQNVNSCLKHNAVGKIGKRIN